MFNSVFDLDLHRSTHSNNARLQLTATRSQLPHILTTILAVMLSGTAAQAVPIAPGYTVNAVGTAGNAYGGVVTVGDYTFVGVGSFGNTEIVRIAPGGATTTIATGFSSLAGFTYDAINDRLIVGDNFTNGSTGDTLYALSDPVGFAGAPASAATLELLPTGSFPGIADVAMDPNDPTGMTLFVTDATEAFPPTAGGVIEVVLGTSATLTPIFGVGSAWFAAGVAASTDTLFVGSAIFGVGGRIQTTALPIANVPTVNFLADGPSFLPGQFDLELEASGMLLSTSGNTLIRIDPATGVRTNVATGFGFASALAAGDDGSIWVVDGISLFKFTPVPEPGTALLVGFGLLGITAAARRSRSLAQTNLN